MLGRQLILAFGRSVVASSVTCEVDMQTDTIEVASPTSGVFRDYIPSLCDWSISTSGLIKSTQQQYDLFELWRNRAKLRVNYYDTEMRMVRSGYAIITNLRESAPNRSIPTYSISLQGCGELENVPYSSRPVPNQELFGSGVHIAFAADGNTKSSSPNNHFFEQQQGATIFVSTLPGSGVFARLKLNYYSGMSEYHPLVIVIRNSTSDWYSVKNTIEALDTFKFVKEYEVTHFGGKNIDKPITTELLLTPGYAYRIITDSDMAISYLSAQVLTLPTQ